MTHSSDCHHGSAFSALSVTNKRRDRMSTPSSYLTAHICMFVAFLHKDRQTDRQNLIMLSALLKLAKSYLVEKSYCFCKV